MQPLRSGDAFIDRQQPADCCAGRRSRSVGVYAGHGLGALRRADDHRCLLKEYCFLLVRRTCKSVSGERDSGGWDVPDAGAVRVYDADHSGGAVWVQMIRWAR